MYAGNFRSGRNIHNKVSAIISTFLRQLLDGFVNSLSSGNSKEACYYSTLIFFTAALAVVLKQFGCGAPCIILM